jgi:FtsZ-binding cell division protein ZapB
MIELISYLRRAAEDTPVATFALILLCCALIVALLQRLFDLLSDAVDWLIAQLNRKIAELEEERKSQATEIEELQAVCRNLRHDYEHLHEEWQDTRDYIDLLIGRIQDDERISWDPEDLEEYQRLTSDSDAFEREDGTDGQY